MEETHREPSGPPLGAEDQAGLQVAAEPAEEEVARQPEMSRDARNMAMLCHLLGIVGFFAPLLIWLIEREKHRFVDEHGREAMNYQVSLLIYVSVSSLLILVRAGFYLLAAFGIAHVILTVIGAVRASQGKAWRYPIAIPFLR